ncbi:MAG: EAL domain-containing protein [Propionivibrio sp.]|nr:EAL domain-containing protein [Propionivibrio sp.]
MIMLAHDALKVSSDGSEVAQDFNPLSSKAGQRALQLFVRAVESSANGIMITDAIDPKHPIIYVNPAFERITGYPASAVIGRNARFLAGSALDQPALEVIRNALRQHRAAQAVVQCFRQDETLFWNQLSVTPVPDEHGEIGHFVSIFEDVSERVLRENQLLHLSTHDALTGLANRTLLADRLDQAVTHSVRDGGVVAVLLIDLDRFKQINDSLGHAVGDLLLKTVAERLGHCVREGDTVARLGGDEFVLVLADLSRNEDASMLARKILAALSRPIDIDGHELFVTPSIGISFYPQDGADASSLLRHADLAMYQVKSSGRNGFSCFSQDMNERAQEMAELESSLRQALEHDELTLYYQPKADLYSGEICGAEALIRWQHPVKGLVPPSQFIKLAEESGMIQQLGEWVLREACRQAARWQREGMHGLTIAVNFSARQFRQKNIVEIVAQALNDAGLDAKWLQLELTETMIMQNLETSESLLRRLKALGVSLAMDDFGTGYSSLGYLKRFPFDCLKIDQSFVRNITTEPDDALIAIAVIAMAHSLHLYVVAEGVETESQMRYLRNQNCDQLQGYYFSPPLAAGDFSDFVRRAERLPMRSAVTGRDLRTLLLVDDDPEILNALKRLLHRSGYRILTATSGAAALELLALNDVQVIVSDQRMPEMSGSEFLSRVKDLYPDTVRMILSGYSDLADLTNAINRGAISRFLIKPWVDDELREQIHTAFIHQAHEQAARVDHPSRLYSGRPGPN